MGSHEKQTHHTPDEVDLVDLLAKAILIIKKNTIMITATFLVGCGIGWAYHQFSPKIYESKMLISSDILTESYSKSLIDNLSKLIKERNEQSLSEKLGLSLNHASKITKIEIKSALEGSGETSENTKIYFNITVEIKDNSIWPHVQTGLLNFFQNNEFVKTRVEQRKKNTIQVIEKINLELLDLEKFKTSIAEGSFAQSNKGGLFLFDPTTVNSKILELSKEKIKLQNSLETINSIQVVEGFTVFKKPVSPKLSLSLVGGASVGMLMAIIVMALKAIRLMLRFAEEKLGGV